MIQWRVLKRAIRERFDQPDHLLSLAAGRNAIRDVVEAAIGGSKSPTDRREWRQRPTAERIAYANKLLVLHPRFREAMALLERCHQSSKQAGEPVCGAILGSSGVGKTSVVDHYCRLHPPRETDTANCQPVLKVTLQPDACPKGIAADLLLALGDPAWSSGTVESLTNRAARLLKHCGVELIVLDAARRGLRPRRNARPSGLRRCRETFGRDGGSVGDRPQRPCSMSTGPRS